MTKDCECARIHKPRRINFNLLAGVNEFHSSRVKYHLELSEIRLHATRMSSNPAAHFIRFGNSDIEAIRNGFEGLTVSTIIDAYIKIIDWFNNESYGGEPYYEEVTLDNVGEIIDYYNGETYEEYLQRFAEENMDINDIVNSK